MYTRCVCVYICVYLYVFWFVLFCSFFLYFLLFFKFASCWILLFVVITNFNENNKSQKHYSGVSHHPRGLLWIVNNFNQHVSWLKNNRVCQLSPRLKSQPIKPVWMSVSGIIRMFFYRSFVTNQLAWLELPVTPHKVNFLFVSSTLRAVAGTGRELLTKVFLTECQPPDRGGRGGGGRRRKGRGRRGGGGGREEEGRKDQWKIVEDCKRGGKQSGGSTVLHPPPQLLSLLVVCSFLLFHCFICLTSNDSSAPISAYASELTLQHCLNFICHLNFFRCFCFKWLFKSFHLSY